MWPLDNIRNSRLQKSQFIVSAYAVHNSLLNLYDFDSMLEIERGTGMVTLYTTNPEGY